MAERKLGNSFSLWEIIKEEGQVFLDSSLMPGPFYYTIRKAASFRELDLPKLQSFNRHLSETSSAWSVENTFSTPKVLDEIALMQEMIYKQLRFFERREQSEHLPRWKHEDQRESLTVQGRDLLSSISTAYSIILRKAILSKYSPQDKDLFVLLENKVIEVGEETSAKVKYNNKRRSSRTDQHTDEQLVAAALYSSVVEKNPCSIVSIDSDIQRLVVQTQVYFNERKDLWEVSKALRENPIRVYFVDKNKIECSVDTSQPDSFRYAYSSRRVRHLYE